MIDTGALPNFRPYVSIENLTIPVEDPLTSQLTVETARYFQSSLPVTETVTAEKGLDVWLRVLAVCVWDVAIVFHVPPPLNGCFWIDTFHETFCCKSIGL